jgi:hypothetical protein
VLVVPTNCTDDVFPGVDSGGTHAVATTASTAATTLHARNRICHSLVDRARRSSRDYQRFVNRPSEVREVTAWSRSQPAVTTEPIVRKLAIVLLVLVTLAACGGDDDDNAARTTTTRAGQPTLAPLTGRKVTADVADRAALSVKIANNDVARPQTGIEQADVVFEELTEGGITRFLAVFQSQLPPDVGPIRSVRAVDPALITPLGGVFAYSGGTAVNVDAVRKAPVTTIDETAAGAAMHRIPQREPPHNLYGTPSKLLALAGDHDEPPTPLFVYGRARASAKAQPCTSFGVLFSGSFQSNYTWKQGAWYRSENDDPFVTASGKQVTATNLVVLQLKDQSRDAAVGTGDAIVLRDGTLARGTWERRDEHDAFHLTDASGATLTLAPGNTWVHLAVPGTLVGDRGAGCAPAK